MSGVSPTIEVPSMHDTKDSEVISSTSLDRSAETRQSISRLDLFGISFNVISVVPSVATVLMFSLPGGGTHGMTWAWLVCAIFVTVIALAVVQLLGASPTTAGVYNRAHSLSPSKYRSVLSWVVGYVNIIGNIASVASICWAISSHIMAVAFVGSDFVGTRAETFGVYLAVLLLQAIAHIYAPADKPGVPRFFMIGNILLWAALIVALPTASQKPLNTPKFVFGTFTNVTKAWDNNASQLSTSETLLYIMISYPGRATATVHMADVARKPKQDIAYAVAAGTLVNAIMAIALNVALAFSMGNNLHAILNNSHGEPVSAMLLHALGSKGTMATYAFIILLQFNSGATMLSATSSHASAFIHDNGLLSSADGLARIVRLQTSTAVACCSLLASALLGLLALAGTGAINSLFATAVVGQLLAFIIAIISSKCGDPATKVGGGSAISLGFLDSPISIVAVIIMTVLSAFFLFPQNQHPSPGNVNYTALIIGTSVNGHPKRSH
ncbi:hypothetical protein D9619_009770 [Psilocybe cf. subviscida]|uniref:Amino acid transporter n=1 Tax=Psilocybe cf. subviscida TaxID=2480587 RepID=A0A8H5F648_9AGAR|nr:hypothetical protein D9619_009770 [Psilocybe cf. subviscida]